MIVGDLIDGRYQITARLGRGRSGVVFRVADRRTGRDLALKAAPPDGDPTKTAAALRAEFDLLRGVDHPGVVRAVEWGDRYFTMEYLAGRDLGALGRLEPGAAARVGAEVAEALAHLHTRGVSHGDLTPAHVIVTAESGAKLLDLGGAGGDAVTPEYLAPERLRGGKADPRADLYSLGAVLYRLLTGRPPVRGATPTATMLRQGTAEVPPPSRLSPGCPPAFDVLVLSLLAREPGARAASASVVAETLRRLAGPADGPAVLAPEVAAARLRAVPAPARALAGALAVAGPAAEPGHVARVAGLAPDAAVAAARLLQGAGLLRAGAGEAQSSDPIWSLPDAAIRDVCYRALDGPERQALHARAASDHQSANGAGAVAAVAHHRFHAGDAAGAATALRGAPVPLPGMEAGAGAELLAACRAATGDAALALLEGEQHLAAGWPDRAAKAFTVALEATGDPAAAAGLAGAHLLAGRLADAERAAADGLALARPGTAARARLLARRGVAALLAGDPTAPEAALGEALLEAETSREGPARAEAYCGLALAALAAGDGPRAAQNADRASGAAPDGHPLVAFAALAIAAAARRRHGPGPATAARERARAAAEAGGFGAARMALDLEEAWAGIAAGTLDEALAAAAGALRDARESGVRLLEGAALLTLARGHTAQGNTRRGIDLAREASQLLRGCGARPLAALAALAHGEAALRQGEHDHAARSLHAAAAVLRETRHAPGAHAVATARALLDVRRGDVAGAETALAEAATLARAWPEPVAPLHGVRGAVEALAHRAAGRPEPAEKAFRDATDALERAGAHLPWAEAAADYARALVGHGDTDPGPAVWRRARDLAARAVEIQVRAGAERASARTRLLLSECEGRLPAGAVPATASAPASASASAPATGAAPAVPDGRLATLEAEVARLKKDLEAITAERQGLTTLHRVSRAITSETDLKKLVPLILDMAVEVVAAERGFLILREEAGPLKFAAARNVDRDTIQRPEGKISFSIAREVINTGEPVLTTDAREDERFRDRLSVQDLRLTSVLCVPLRARARVIGAVYLDNRFVAGCFSQMHLEFLQSFANQAAIALENTRLYDENLRKTVALEAKTAEVEGLNAELSKKVERQGVELAAARTALERERAGQALRYTYDAIIGRSARMRVVLGLVDRVTDSKVSVFIHGESGTGKELIARAIHFNGPRRAKAFAAENCSALPDTLLESELFGHVKGAFTGADRDRKGLFEIADGGTLFLDEVGDMTPEMQKKLLRVLQEEELRRVGGRDTIRVDVRIVSASNKDLRTLMAEGKFREDLFYRLNVIGIELPPLRERPEDVPELALHFAAQWAAQTGGTAPRFTPDALAALAAYRWPGNVRELENEVKKASTLAAGPEIDAAHLSVHVRAEPAAGTGGAPGDLHAAVEALERQMIAATLTETKGNRSHAAKRLGLSRYGLLHKIKRFGLEAMGTDEG